MLVAERIKAEKVIQSLEMAVPFEDVVKKPFLFGVNQVSAVA